ncbi:hypothetical protein ABPG75_013105 [Micractinium tetrahymenae]
MLGSEASAEGGASVAEGGASASASAKPTRKAPRAARQKEPQQEEQQAPSDHQQGQGVEEQAENGVEQPVEQPAQGKRGGSSRLNAASQAAKLAAAREKNRLAQQRFRERQRIKQKAAGAQCVVLAKDIDQLRVENELLQRQNRMYQRFLAVRDAMLHALTTLEPAEQAEQAGQARQALAAAPQPWPAAAAAAQGLARALEALPTEEQMEEAAPTSPAEGESGASADGEAPAAATGTRGADSSSSSPVGSAAAQAAGAAEAPAQQPQQPEDEQQQQQQQPMELDAAVLPGGSPPQSVLGEAHRTGTSSALDGSALQEVELIPAPNNQAVRAKIAEMSGPDDLLAFVREWQAELRAAYQAAEAAGFDDASVAEVEATTDRMTNMWWHVGQLQPAWLSALAYKAYPENSGQLPLWREIAAEVLPELDESSRALVRRSWHQYCKRMAKAAVGAARWVRRLQEFTLRPLDCMSAHAAQSLELAEITGHIKAAVQEEYVASMEFVAAQFPASTTLQKAYVNYRSAPWLPDLVAIVWNMLALDAEERQAAGRVGPHEGSGDLGCVPRPGALPAPLPPQQQQQQQKQAG